MSTTLEITRATTNQIQVIGTAMGIGSTGIMVNTESGVYTAQRAVSCLLEPVAGDRVLVAGDPEQELYVLAILQRNDPSPFRLAVEGDLSLAAPRGRITMAAAESIDLISNKKMTLTSADLTVRAATGNIFLDQITCLGSRIFAEISKIKLVGRYFDTIAERLTQRVKRCYRVVDEIDQVRCNQIDYRADKTLSLRGQNAMIDAEDLVKIDGDQIHLG